MKKMTELEKHYNKFNEDKRLTRRRGYVEFYTSMVYIKKCLQQLKFETAAPTEDAGSEVSDTLKIIDIGAGTGRYSFALAQDGYEVTAVEPVKYNLGILKSKGDSVRAVQGNALKLSKFKDNSFDLALLFGPMYHLYTFEDKLKALMEAKRVVKSGGFILAAYFMNEYGIIVHGFKDNTIKKAIEEGRIDENFHIKSGPEDLYEFSRIEDIHRLSDAAGLRRVKIISVDGAANYMRPVLNSMDEETFEIFLRYNLSVCERQELTGAGTHTVDILRKL